MNSETDRESKAAIRPSTSIVTRNTIVKELCPMTVSREIDSTEIDLWITNTSTSFEQYSIVVLYEKIPLKNSEFWDMISNGFLYSALPSKERNTSESSLQYAIENFAFKPCLMITNFIIGSDSTVEIGSTHGTQSEVQANLRPDVWVKHKDRGSLFWEVKLPDLKFYLDERNRFRNKKLLGYIRQMILYCLALPLHKSVLSDGKSLYLTFYEKNLDLYSASVIPNVDKLSKLVTIDEIYSRYPTFDDKITANMVICLLLFEGYNQGSQTLISEKDAVEFKRALDFYF